MHFQKIYENKKSYLNLLLIADEEECMIDRYLDRGEMFALYEDDLRALCVVTCLLYTSKCTAKSKVFVQCVFAVFSAGHNGIF